MKCGKSLIALIVLSTFTLLLDPTLSAAAGPEPIGGVVSSPIGSNVGKPAPPATGKSAALPAEPKWPQNFEMGVGERTGFGFVVGQPGPIVVTVKWRGAPLSVTLAKPGRGGAVERQGSGVVTIKYTATALDVRKGVLWGVSLRAAREGTNPSTAAGRRYQVAAKGTVAVQHPPGDMNRAQAELNARVEKTKALESRMRTAAAPPGDVPAQRKVATTGGGTGTIMPPAPAKGVTESSKASANAPGVTDPGLAIDPPMIPPPGKVPPRKSIPPEIRSPVDGGSNPPTAVRPDPVILSLDRSAGQPGNDLRIRGRDFSNVPCEVHFVIGPGNDRTGAVIWWYNSEILVSVPNVVGEVGVVGYDGYVYLRIWEGSPPAFRKSNDVAFRFNPLEETRTLYPDYWSPSDTLIAEPRERRPGWIFHGDYTIFGDYFGGKGDDEYFRTTRLKNGWVADEAVTGAQVFPGDSDAYTSEFRKGTDSPFLKIHWWYLPGSSGVVLTPRVIIRGPKGVPHQ